MKILISLFLVILSLNVKSEDTKYQISKVDNLLDTSISENRAKSNSSRHTIHKSGVNNTTDGLGIPDIGASPVVKHMLREKDSLVDDKIHKPKDTDLVISYTSNHTAKEIQEAMEAGVILIGTQEENEQKIDEYNRMILCKRIAIVVLIILCVAGVWIYMQKRSKKREIVNNGDS